MKLKQMMRSFFVGVCVLLCAGVANAGYISTQTAVEPGKWTSDFDGALAYSEKNNIPMMVFWANVGCGNCATIEKAMNNDSSFQKWKDDIGILMVFVESNSKVKTWIKNGCPIDPATGKKKKISKYPYMGVYWPKNTAGAKVYAGFSAYKGQMGDFGANSNDSNVKQIMDTVDNLLEGWSAGSVTPTPDPEPDPESTPDPEPDPGLGGSPDVAPEVDPAVLFKKSQKLEAIAYNGDDIFGKVAITLDKYNSRRNYLKVSFKITALSGKSYSKSVNVTPDRYGDLNEFIVKFKSPIGEMVFNILNTENGFEVEGEGLDSSGYSVEMGDVKIGGTLETEEMSFTAEFEDIVPDKENYDFIIDAPMGAVAEVKRGKTFSFGRSPTIMYKRFREDGNTWYELAEYDEERYSNVNAVKLTYKTTTGAFSGSFRIYASNENYIEEGKKPTLKKYTAKFNGYVIDGVGVGTVSVKIGRKTYTGTCLLD